MYDVASDTSHHQTSFVALPFLLLIIALRDYFQMHSLI